MPIAAFGLWAGCVVLMNYILVITFFPAMLSWWYQHVKPMEKCCCCCCRSKKVDNLQPSLQDGDNKTVENENDKGQSSAAALAMAHTGEEPRCLETFLGETWANWNIKAAFIVLPCVFITLGLAGWKASEISPLTQQEQWFDEDHYMEKMYACEYCATYHLFRIPFMLKVDLLQILNESCIFINRAATF